MIADPYPRFVVARNQVNQAAAVLLASVGAAQRLGVARDKWVFLHGQADLVERSLLERAVLGEAPSAVAAVRHALQVAHVGLDDIDFFDFYSCFPIAVKRRVVRRRLENAELRLDREFSKSRGRLRLRTHCPTDRVAG